MAGPANHRDQAVFLDRDGVLNESTMCDGVPRPPRSQSELVLLPGVEEACAALRGAGWLLIVVTNQPEIARGTLSPAIVDEINDRLRHVLQLDDVLVCPHDDADECQCRKPRAGLLRRAAASWSLDLQRSYMVGDRWRDVEAGREAGCVTIHVDRGYSERRPQAPDLVVDGLPEAAREILHRGLQW